MRYATKEAAAATIVSTVTTIQPSRDQEGAITGGCASVSRTGVTIMLAGLRSR